MRRLPASFDTFRPILALLVVASLCLPSLPADAQEPAAFDVAAYALLAGSLPARSPYFGPESVVLSAPGEEIAPIGEATLQDFALRFACRPDGASGCRLIFRSGGSGGIALSLFRDGHWTLGAAGQPPAQASLPDDAGPAWSLPATIDLLVAGNTGLLGVEGAHVATLDLADYPDPGVISLAAIPAGGDEEGVAYESLTIWRFDRGDAAAAAMASGPPRFITALAELAGLAPMAGPREGELEHVANRVAFARAGVTLSGMAVHLVCDAPSEAPLWDCGIAFRLGATADAQFRLIVTSDGRWILAQGVSAVIQSGSFDAGPIASGGSIGIDLIAFGPSAAFAVNGVFVASLDVAALTEAGDVAAGTAFFPATSIVGESTPYHEFTVWALDRDPLIAATPQVAAGASAPPDARLAAVLIDAATAGEPAFGPLNGELAHDPSAVTLLPSSLEVRDFALRLQCLAPAAAGDRLWDCGVIVRSSTPERQVRVVIVSDGYWSARTGAGDLIAEGTGLAVAVSPSVPLSLDLLALGDTGFLLVDGVLVSRLDLSSIPAAGEALAGTAFFNETYRDDGVTDYAEFTIWSLDALTTPRSATPVAAPPSGSPEAGASGSPEPEELGTIVAEAAPAHGAALLEPMGGAPVHGYAQFTRVARSIEVIALAINVPEGALVVVQPGGCDALQREGALLAGRLDDRGSLAATLDIRLTELINLGPYAAAIYPAGDTAYANPLACGAITALP
jgi:hypothetical protein